MANLAFASGVASIVPGTVMVMQVCWCSVVWSVIQRDVPVLLIEVVFLLAKGDERASDASAE
jgi:hypothetical protein